jgi:hypothetical protein
MTYCFRHLDAQGRILRYHVAHCEDDSEAFRIVAAEAPPIGYSTVEIERGERAVWSGGASGLGVSMH